MNSRSLLPFLGKKSKTWGLTIALWASLLLPAQASKPVNLRVAIEDGISQINVGSNVDAQVLDATERQALGEIKGMNGFAAQAKNGQIALDRWQASAMTIMPKDPNGVVWIGDRWYRGTVRLIASGSGITVVNSVELEQYLMSVLGAEMNGNWPQEALKAQAVTARSYALQRREASIRAGKQYDLYNTQASQVYKGLLTESAGTQQAVLETAGLVLAYNNAPIEAVFHSSAGGCTENSEDVWTSHLPYLRAGRNDFDGGTPVSEWSKTLSASAMGNLFGVGTVQEVTVVKSTPVCQRVQKMQIRGDRKTVTLDGDDVRGILGLKSTLFTITAQKGTGKTNNKETQFVVNGRGFGHGLGMSQWAAYNMARKNKTYPEILGQFYQKVQIVPITLE